jgi:hypothetical protein
MPTHKPQTGLISLEGDAAPSPKACRSAMVGSLNGSGLLPRIAVA